MNDIAQILSAYRHGKAPSPDQIVQIVTALTDRTMSDAQIGAFAMAVCAHDLPSRQSSMLAHAMTESGTKLTRVSARPRLDKHSTGGLGDATSLVLAPMLAAIGADVPMISGRALGHTGGTLDKLEAWPGLSTDIGLAQISEILAQCGCVIASATPEIAPADRVLYAIRDQTGTVDHPALITASILSKKGAANLDKLVLDVKIGNGAFLPDPEMAEGLAQLMVQTATANGLPCSALLTAMDQPLLNCIGPSLELAACMACLQGDSASQPRFMDLVLALGEELVLGTNLVEASDAPAKLAETLSSGAAYERFAHMAVLMGGASAPHISQAPVMHEIPADRSGAVSHIDCRALGWAAAALGHGRTPYAGLSQIKRLGDDIHKGEALCVLHCDDQDNAEDLETRIRACFSIEERAEALPLIYSRMRSAVTQV